MRWKSTAFVTIAALLLVMPAAQAVTIDLSSPQAGTTVYPGDTIEFSAAVTNDTDDFDLIMVAFTLTADVPGDPVTFEGAFRIGLDAGETAEQAAEYDIPADLQVPAPVVITIEAVATGMISDTTDSDVIGLTLAPTPGKSRDALVTIDLSSPQAGGTVYPGDTVEITASLTNGFDEADVIEVNFVLSADIPDNPMSFEGSFRVPLEAGETANKTLEFEIPADLQVPAPILVTLEADAAGLLSGGEDSDVLAMTLAPLPLAMPDGGVDIDLSSPQEGATLNPGDTIELTASIANGSDEDDVIEVTVTLTVDVPGEPMTHEAVFRLPLAAGETAAETLEAEIPNVPLDQTVQVTIDATAVGIVSGTEDSDSMLFYVAPAGKSLFSKMP